MGLKQQLIAGAVALTIGLSAMVPARALADSDDWHPHDSHAWQSHRDQDHDRDWRNHDYGNYAGRGYAAPNGGYLPPNGQGMVNQRNPNFVWACDSDGHHCHWAHR